MDAGWPGRADVTVFADTTVVANKAFKYRVRAYNAVGYSPYSNVVGVFTPKVVAASQLSAIVTSTSHIDVTWSDNGSDEKGFIVLRSANKGKTWSQVGQVGIDVTTFADTGVIANKLYRYRVRAFNTAGSSDFSNTVIVATPPVVAPTNLIVSAVSSRKSIWHGAITETAKTAS